MIRFMVTALLALIFVQTSVSLTPSDDVWIYEHASDPAGDPFLRIWGASGKPVSDDPADTGQFSYGYLRWNLTTVPSNSKITGAKLIVKQVADPGYSSEDAKACPLEARALEGMFDEKSWTFSLAAKVYPKSGAEALYGSGYPQLISKDQRAVPITIDLMGPKSSFGSAISAALASGTPTLCIALTSKIDPSTSGRTAVYKVYSKDAELAENRPVLSLTFEPK